MEDFGLGAVIVSYGSATGLNPRDRQLFADPASSGRTITYGRSVVAGDLDRDGFGDLVIGEPQYGLFEPDRPEAAGAVEILFGGPAGLRTETTRRLGPPPGSWVYFAQNLALGDVTGDGYTDLVVGGSSRLARGGQALNPSRYEGADRRPADAHRAVPMRAS